MLEDESLEKTSEIDEEESLATMEDDDNALIDKNNDKYERSLYNASLYESMNIIVYYIIGDIKNKMISFKIGVTAIFLVVTFVMMFKSLIDISPIAFLFAA